MIVLFGAGGQLGQEILALARSVPGADAYDWDAGTAGLALYVTGVPR